MIKAIAISTAGLVGILALVLTLPPSGGQAAQQLGPAIIGDGESEPMRYSLYKVIEGESIGPFSDKVTHALRGGWIPAGGITVVNGRYLQAVVK